MTKAIATGEPVRPEAPFAVHSEYAGRAARLALHGELDLATVAILDEQLRAAWARDVARIELDLRGLRFIGSAGIAAILETGARARERGCALTLVRGPDDVHRIFELTGIVDRFAFRRTG